MKETLARVSAYDPAFIEKWKRRSFGARDEATVEAVLKAYEDWYDARTHVFVRSEKDIVGQPSAAIVLQEQKNIKYIIATGPMEVAAVFRRQITEHPGLRDLSPMELAARICEDGFGYSNEGYKNGEYLSSNSTNYPDFWNRKWRMIARRIEEASAEDFMDRLDQILLGKIRSHYGKERAQNYRKLYRHLRLVERQKMRIPLHDIVSTLDPKALDVMRRARFLDTSLYEWLTGYSTETSGITLSDKELQLMQASPDAVRARQDAIAALPILAPFASTSYHARRQFTDAIDSGKSLLEAMNIAQNDRWSRRNHSGFEKGAPVSKEMMMWMRGKTHHFIDGFEVCTNPHMYHFISDLDVLSELPREWRPANAEQNKILISVGYAVSDWSQYLNRPKGKLMREYMSYARKPETAPVLFKNGKASMDVYTRMKENKDRVNDDYNGFRDFKKALENQIILPEILRQAEKRGVSYARLQGDENRWSPQDAILRPSLSRLFNGLSLVQLLNLNERWHRQSERLETRVNSLDKDTQWKPLFKPMVLPDGVKAKCLASTRELQEEGHNMDHCVGGYTFQCCVENSHIVSLKAPDGSWSTTVEFKEVHRDDPRGLRVEQNKGPGNEVAPAQAVKAAELIIRHLKMHQPNWNAIDAGREKHKHDALLMKIGFDYRLEEACNRAYDSWHGTFPNFLPYGSRNAFLEQTGLGRYMAHQIKVLRKHGPGAF